MFANDFQISIINYIKNYVSIYRQSSAPLLENQIAFVLLFKQKNTSAPRVITLPVEEHFCSTSHFKLAVNRQPGYRLVDSPSGKKFENKNKSCKQIQIQRNFKPSETQLNFILQRCSCNSTMHNFTLFLVVATNKLNDLTESTEKTRKLITTKNTQTKTTAGRSVHVEFAS